MHQQQSLNRLKASVAEIRNMLQIFQFRNQTVQNPPRADRQPRGALPTRDLVGEFDDPDHLTNAQHEPNNKNLRTKDR